MLTYLLCVTFFLARAIRGRKRDTKDVGNKEIKNKVFTPLHLIAFVPVTVHSLLSEEKNNIIFLHHYVNFSLVLNMPYKRKTIGLVAGEMAQKKKIKKRKGKKISKYKSGVLSLIAGTW